MFSGRCILYQTVINEQKVSCDVVAAGSVWLWASSHPGDDLKAGLLLLVDLQSWDDFTQQVGHFLWGALVLLLCPPESIKYVVGDFGEAAQGGDIRVLPELLLETNCPFKIQLVPETVHCHPDLKLLRASEIDHTDELSGWLVCSPPSLWHHVVQFLNTRLTLMMKN